MDAFVSPATPAVGNARFFRTVALSLLVPGLVVISSSFVFFRGMDRIKSAALLPQASAAEPARGNAQIPELARQRMPAESEREGLRARLVLREHERRNDQRMYSLGLEIENASFSQVARVEFDPKDLKVELLDGNGNAIARGEILVSAPVQPGYQVDIFGNSSVTLPVHDHGYGFAGMIWANDTTAWNTPPGDYQIRGSVTVTVTWGRPKVEGPLGDLIKMPDAWEGKPRPVKLTLPLSRFTLPRTP